MKIIIIKIEKKQDLDFISFKCAYGSGVGVWHEDNAEIGAKVDVEFDIEKLQTFTKCLATERSYAITVANGTASLTGDIVDIQDEIVLFRFGETLIQLDPNINTLGVGEWINVSVKAEDFSIYPMNL